MRIQLTFFTTHIYVILREKLFKIHLWNVLLGVFVIFLYIKILILKELVPLPLKRKFKISW